MKKLIAWLTRVTPLRLSLAVALVCILSHAVIEIGVFEFGLFSKKGFVHLLDLKLLDQKFVAKPKENPPEPQIVIAAIDERSIERFGLWPWSRNIVGEFLDAVNALDPQVVAFDVFFADEDKNSSYRSVKRFLDAFGDSVLSPESEGFKVLKSAASEVENRVESSERKLKELKSKLAGPQKKGLNATVAALERDSKRGKARLSVLRKAIREIEAGSKSYREMLVSAVTDVSPDQAFAEAIKRTERPVLGFFAFENEAEVKSLSPEEMARDIEVLQSVAMENIYELAFEDVQGATREFAYPVEVDWDRLQLREATGFQAPLLLFADAARPRSDRAHAAGPDDGSKEGEEATKAQEAQENDEAGLLGPSAHLGFVNVYVDADNSIRRARVLYKYGEKAFPTLSVAIAARYFDSDIYPLDGAIKPGITISGVNIGANQDRFVPTDEQGKMLINYYRNPQDYFETFSIVDIMDGKVPKEKIEGKVVLVGATAIGTYDLRPFAYGTAPGVYIQAAATQNMIDGTFLQRFTGLAVVEILGMLMLGIFMGLVVPRIPALAALGMTLLLFLGFYLIDLNYVFADGTWILNVIPTFQAFSTLGLIILYQYLTEGKEKREIRKAFQFYLTKSVVDEMLKDTTKLKLGGERRVCTVLFSDIRGFTTISEALTPEELSNLLNEYLTPMTNLVFKYDGTLDKYMGDAIMAIFGAPVAHEDHATRACLVALEMMEELGELQKKWAAEGQPHSLDIGIGLNTGAMSVGNMGSEVRFDYTVMGDQVNLGSRLEGINKQYGTNIIISEYTYEAAKNGIHAREIDLVKVKGKNEPVRIYELMGRGQATGNAKDVIDQFDAGIAAYRAQRWDDAIAIFDRIRREIKPDDFTSSMYIDRCNQLRNEDLGEQWDGVFTMTTK